MRRTQILLTLVMLCVLLAGCGGSKDRGKFKDEDRPKATGSK